MTIIEAINRIDTIKPNSFSQTEKVRWLNTLDGIIKKEIIDTHEGLENIVFNGYNDNTPISTELLVSSPYDDVYIRYLEMQMDYANGEYNKYENSVDMYNTAYTAVWRHYNRNYTPIGKTRKFF